MKKYTYEYVALLAVTMGLLLAIQCACATIQGVTVWSDAPNVTSFTPSSPVFDTLGDARSFSIVLDQKATVSWAINGTEVFNESNVTHSTYTMPSAPVGVWELTATASSPNGTVVHEWMWIVHAKYHSRGRRNNTTEASPELSGENNFSDTPISPEQRGIAVPVDPTPSPTLHSEAEQSLWPLIGAMCIFAVSIVLIRYILKRIER
jgi:hypothetical protein